jgi:hypothetical protein
MDINYKQKYLKYKYKYLQLQQGGTAVVPVDNYDEQQEQNKNAFELEKSKNDNQPQDIFVSGTHGTQMLCSLKNYGISLLKKEKKDKNRFMNCSVVELYYLPNSNICCVSLVYNGELSKTKLDKAKDHEKYFINESSSEELMKNKSYKVFKPQYVQLKKTNNIKKPTRLYLCRHGDGFHTSAGKSDKFTSLLSWKDNNKIFDANLTPEGETQGANAANDLIEHLKKIGYKKDKDKISFGASDLLRAIRTTNIYLKKYNENYKDTKDTVNIVSCSHEIGECGDGIYALGLNKFTNENKTICGYKGERESVGKKLIQQKQSNATCMKIDDINIKWDVYDSFFGDVKRGDAKGTTLCSKENMIDIILDKLQASEFN